MSLRHAPTSFLVVAALLATPAICGAVDPLPAGGPPAPKAIRDLLVQARSDAPGLPDDVPPWPGWQASPATCELSVWEHLDRQEQWAILQECGMEAIDLFRELAQVAFPEAGKGHFREGVEFVGAGTGVPDATVKCYAKGIIVHKLRLADSSEAEMLGQLEVNPGFWGTRGPPPSPPAPVAARGPGGIP